jgi:hypothetical protein
MQHGAVRVKVLVQREDGSYDCIGRLHLKETQFANLRALLEAGARTTGHFVWVTGPFIDQRTRET